MTNTQYITLTYQEVAEAARIPYNTVLSLISRNRLTGKSGVIQVDDKLLSIVDSGRLSAYLLEKAEAARLAESEAALRTKLRLFLGYCEGLHSRSVEEYYFSMGLSLSICKQLQRMSSVFWVLANINCKSDANAWGFGSATEMKTAVMAELNAHRDSLHNFNVQNLRVFTDKMKPFLGLGALESGVELSDPWKLALESLVSKKIGMQNRAYPAFHYEIIRFLYADMLKTVRKGAKLDDTEIHRRYTDTLRLKYNDLVAGNMKPDDKDFQAMSRRNVREIVNSLYTEAFFGAERHGKGYMKRNYSPYHHRGKPGVMSILSSDGISLGELVTGGKVTAWIWWDWASGAALGAAFAQGGESVDMVISSFRSVYLKTGVLPKAVQIDDKMRYKAGIKSFFERLGIDIDQMKKENYNPQESIAETRNRQLNRVHRKISGDWVNITNSSEEFTRRWEDVKDGKYKNVSEYERSVLDMLDIINGTPVDSLDGKCPMEVFTAGLLRLPKAEGSKRWERYYFGESSVVEVKRGCFKVVVKEGQKPVKYMVENWYSYLTQNEDSLMVRVCWLRENPEEVEIFRVNKQAKSDRNHDEWLCSCKPYRLYNPLPDERTDQDDEAVKTQSKEVEKFRKAKRDALEKNKEVIENYDLLDVVETAVTNRFEVERNAGKWKLERPAAENAIIHDANEEEEDGDIYNEYLKNFYNS